LILIPEKTNIDQDISGSNTVFACGNPRLTYAVLMSTALDTMAPRAEEYIQIDGAVVSRSATISDNVRLEPGVFVDHDVIIEEGVQLLSGVSVRSYVHIGENTIIGENTVIGSDGFGFERDALGNPIHLPHLGGVIIGSNVKIGSITAVCTGTIDPTVIEDDVKIDNLVHVAHNCKVGRGTLITACAEISGSVTIGENVWIGPNASILQGLEIGDQSTVGLGAVVIKSVPNGEIVAGNPAKPTREISLYNKAISRIVRQEENRSEGHD